MNLKKATLAAAVCASPVYVYSFLVLLIVFPARVATGQSWTLVATMCACLSGLGLAAFLFTFFREQCGRAGAPTRRKVARIAAALMGVWAAWLAFSAVKTVLRASSSTAVYDWPWTLVRMTLLGVVASALWSALLSRFASREDPLQDASTRLLALILAADTALAGLWQTYSLVPTLRAWRGGYSSVWEVLLPLAIESVVWISLFVFLLSLWRFPARAAEAVSGRASLPS